MVLNATGPAATRDEFGAETVFQRILGTRRQGTQDGGHWVEFQALGTRCRLMVSGTPPAADRFAEAALRWLAHFEAKYSRFLPDSLVSRINASAGRNAVAIDAETERIFALCQELFFLTRGIFDPTSLPLIQLWNWKAKPSAIPSEEQIEATRAKLGWREVQRTPGSILLPRPGMGLDLGGMGKEYAVDQISQMARQFGIPGALVDFGADVRVFGSPPDGRPGWHVGLEDPKKPGTCWRGLAVREGAVATSGDYLRGFELNGIRYSHILDPRTGRPVSNGVHAVSVVAPSCTQAGMLSTSALILGPLEGIRLLDATAGAAGAIVTETQTLCSRRFHEQVAS